MKGDGVPVRIVTDSTADLTPALAEQHRITVVPLNILFGDESFLDVVEMDSEAFFRRLAWDKTLPTTSQPSPAGFEAAYRQLVAEGATDIVSIHVSGRLSKTIDSARIAAAGIEGARVHFVDSRLASLALGLGAVTAGEAAERGATAEEVQALVADQFRRTRIFFVLDTLEYLRRGGRIGRAREVLGSVLQLKPVLSFEDGEVVPVGRARTRRKALEDLLQRIADLRPFEQAMAVHATTPEDLQYVVERLHGIAPDALITTGRITPVIGVHAGPGLVAAGVVLAKDSSPAASPP